MPQVTRILCPVDFSDFSRHAVDYALTVAHWYGGAITALHVIPPPVYIQPIAPAPLYPPIVFTPDDLEQFRRETAMFVEAESGRAPIEAIVVEGDPAKEIARIAKELSADMLVMGTHGRTGFERLLLGSVTERVLRKAPCPVLTVPRRVPDMVPTGPALFKRILCAVDFSPSSLKALEYARSLAEAAGGQLAVVHVVEFVAMLEPVLMGGPGAPQFEQVVRDNARTRLHEVVSRQSVGTPASEIVGEGKPYREILRVATDQGSDLIVIGVHGGAAGLMAFGSTTNHIVREATCPVLSVRA